MSLIYLNLWVFLIVSLPSFHFLMIWLVGYYENTSYDNYIDELAYTASQKVENIQL